MHSIIDSLMNNTGKVITQKVGNFFSKKTGTADSSFCFNLWPAKMCRYQCYGTKTQ